MKKILCLILTLVLCLSVFAGCAETGKKNNEGPGNTEKPSVNSSVDAVLTNAVSKTQEAYAKHYGKPLNDLAAIMDHGEMVISVIDVFRNTLHTDKENECFSNILDIDHQDTQLSLGLYGSGTEYAIQIPQIFGEEAYGVDMSTLLTDLKDSELLTSMGMTSEDLDTIIEQFQPVIGLVEGVQGGSDELFTEIVSDIKNVINGVEKSAADASEDILGDSVNVTQIVYIIEEDDLIALVSAFEDAITELLKSMGLNDEDISVEDLSGELETFLEDADAEGKFIVSVSKETGCIAAVSMNVTLAKDEHEGSIDARLELGAAPGHGFALSMNAESDGAVMGVNIQLDVLRGGRSEAKSASLKADMSKDTSMWHDIDPVKAHEIADGAEYGLYELKIEVVSDDVMEEFMISFAHETNGDFELEIDGVGTVNGTLVVAEDEFLFEICSVVDVDGSSTDIDLSVSAKPINDDVSKEFPADYKNVLKLSGADLEVFMAIMGHLMGHLMGQ